VKIVIACDQNTDKNTLSTQVNQPFLDATSSTWRVIPKDIDADGEYIFYAYVELDGKPNGPSTWTNSMTLGVGCTETTMMTDSTSPAFVSNLPVNCLDHAATYTFY